MTTPWMRPADVEYPRVWHTFQTLNSFTNKLTTYRVQDLPPERFEDAIEHMCKYFLRDEPICASLKLADDPVAVGEICAVWRKVVQQKCAVVCFETGSNDIVGLNMLTVVSKGDAAKQEFQSAAAKAFVGQTEFMTQNGHLFEQFPVQHFLSAWGLSVHPVFRGQGLATEILRARLPLCRALGLKLSATVFSHPGSQIPAAKAGFRDHVVMRFDELAKHGYRFPVNVEVNKLMTLSVD